MRTDSVRNGCQGGAMTTTEAIRPFHIEVPQSYLDDLTERLDRTRFPAPVPADASREQRAETLAKEMKRKWLIK